MKTQLFENAPSPWKRFFFSNAATAHQSWTTIISRLSSLLSVLRQQKVKMSDAWRGQDEAPPSARGSETITTRRPPTPPPTCEAGSFLNVGGISGHNNLAWDNQSQLEWRRDEEKTFYPEQIMAALHRLLIWISHRLCVMSVKAHALWPFPYHKSHTTVRLPGFCLTQFVTEDSPSTLAANSLSGNRSAGLVGGSKHAIQTSLSLARPVIMEVSGW